jgi:hypothetical protein
VSRHERVDRETIVGVKIAAANKVVAKLAVLLECPGLECGHELALVDQPVLKRDQAEKQIVLGGAGHGASLLGNRRWRWTFGPDLEAGG